MIIAFETEHSPVMDGVIKKFGGSTPTRQLINSFVFYDNKIYHKDNLYIISQRSLFDGFFKYAALGSLAGLFFGVFINSALLMQASAVLFVAMVAIMSRYLRFYTLRLRLWFKGHKTRITLLSHTYLEESLINELHMRGGFDESNGDI